jgi:ATPase subunit of ABC transporter with duplicated ATPase domains
VLHKYKVNLSYWKNCKLNIVSYDLANQTISLLIRPALQPVEKEHEVHFRFPEPEPLNGTILQLDDVVFSYSKDGPILLNNVNLSANLSSRICIMGENGSGKKFDVSVLFYFIFDRQNNIIKIIS